MLALTLGVSLGVVAAVFAQPATGSTTDADPTTCRVVRLADVGWTDVAATTAVVSRLLDDLGYVSKVTVLSVPVTFASLRNGDIDAFLGNWMPSQRAMIGPYLADGSIVELATNLRGARYTLAVPDYLHDAGLRDFADIARFREALGATIHGIEAGNEANELLHAMIRDDALGLRGFTLVESSEPGMLAAVDRATRARRPIVFLGWAPHPMNTRFRLRYLTGGDRWFGPDFGGATVHTVVRRGYAEACPNVARLLAQLSFTIDDENALMGAILDHGTPAKVAATAWIAAHRQRVEPWLRGVVPLRLPAATSHVARADAIAPPSSFERLMTRHKLPVGDVATRSVALARDHASRPFALVAAVSAGSVQAVETLLRAVPAPLLIALATFGAWLRRRSLALAAFVGAALLFIMNQGYWSETIETLALVVIAAFLGTVIGVPVGVLAARRPALGAALRPVLDLMQTLPTFVYLTPTLVLFGLGVVPGLVSTVIFALPAPIRLTELGITAVPRSLVEAGLAFGATPWQLLLKVELPHAAPTIMAGVTQCIMLSLSMVVIAALVGAGGLGAPIVRALNTAQVGAAIEAGLAIVLVAVILDRLARPLDRVERG